MDNELGAAAVLNANDPADWFERNLRSLFDAVLVQLPNAIEPFQTDGIHDMRVAARRLRSALRDIDSVVGSRPAKPASKALKELADALGSVRDEDVAVEAIEHYLSDPDAASVRTGIDSLINARRVRREAAFDALCEKLSVDFQQFLRHRFEDSLDSLVAELRLTRPGDIHAIGSKVIGSLLNELESLLVRLYDPFDRKTLHIARIGTKRVRYAIDLFADALGNDAGSCSKDFAGMQGFLGDAHDRDVWLRDLYKLIRAKNRPESASHEEIKAAEWLISEFTKTRTRRYRDALGLLSEWESTDLITRLRGLLTVRI